MIEGILRHQSPLKCIEGLLHGWCPMAKCGVGKISPISFGVAGQVAFSEAVNARIVQNVVFLVAGLAVLLLLRAVHHRFYAPRARQPIPGGLHSTPRRSPMRGA